MTLTWWAEGVPSARSFVLVELRLQASSRPALFVKMGIEGPFGGPSIPIGAGRAEVIQVLKLEL